MPVLKARSDGSGHYIHASIHGAVVTFQTTNQGVERLLTAGVHVGARLPLKLLADLTRTGDAYTGRGGVELYEAEQFEFDFKESKESKDLFPACAVTGAFEDLHLVAFGTDDNIQVQLLAPQPREQLTAKVHLSIPLPLLSPSALTLLENGAHIPTRTDAVELLRCWYAKNLGADWERFQAERQTRQQGFSFDAPDELGI